MPGYRRRKLQVKPRRKPVHKSKAISKAKVNNLVRIEETVEFNDITGAGTANPLNRTYSVSLNSCDRAARMATLFRWYKCEKVEYIYQPIYNTFQSSAGAYSIPYVYKVMNKTGNQDSYEINDYKAMGAMPIKLTKPVKFIYKPNWLLGGNPIVNYTTLSTAQAGGPASGIAAFPVASSGNTACTRWLRCPTINTALAVAASSFDNVALDGSIIAAFPNARTVTETAAVNWYGHDIVVDQDVPAPIDVPLIRVYCKITWVFKEPMYFGLNVPSIPVTRVDAPAEQSAVSVPH